VEPLNLGKITAVQKDRHDVPFPPNLGGGRLAG
jgi:hypothetical protein